MMRLLASLISGVVFGLGLAISQMMNPEKVLGFLDITGNWDPSLALVMGGALCVTLVSFRFVLRRPMPLLAPSFQIPTKLNVDKSLLLGATSFGLGWGIAGYCPGPAIAGLTIGSSEPWIFMLAFVFGSSLCGLLQRRSQKQSTSAANAIDA